MKLKLEKVNDQMYDVFWNDTKHIGAFKIDIDGFFYFWADRNDGCWSANSLKLISDKLNEINKPFKEVVDEYFDQERKDFEERARIEYRKLLNETGMFWEWYPQLTGDWDKDKLDWFVEYSKLEERRTSNIGF